MIVPMKLVTLLCLEQDRTSAVDALGGLELMQLRRTAPPATKDVTSLAAQLAECERVIGVVRSAPALKNPPAAPEIADDELVGYASGLISGKAAALKEQERLQHDLDLLAPWGEFDRSAIAKLQAKGVYVTLCATPRNIFDQRKKEDAFPENAAVSVIRMDKNMVHYALVSEVQLEEGAFDPVTLPEETLSEAQRTLADTQTAIRDADTAIVAAKALLPRLETKLASLRDQLEFATARDGMAQSGAIAYLQGYVPVTRIEKLKDAALKNGWALQIDDPAEDDQDVPTYIEKARFLNVLDPLFDFVGISPGYRESDVYMFFFFFFPIFFGMILGDAGYGTLMLVAGAVGLIVLRAKKAARLPLVLLIFLASYTFVWGALNGAWFGLPKDILPGNKTLFTGNVEVEPDMKSASVAVPGLQDGKSYLVLLSTHGKSALSTSWRVDETATTPDLTFDVTPSDMKQNISVTVKNAGWMTGWSMLTDPTHSSAARKFAKFYKIEVSSLSTDKLTQWFCFLLAMLHLMSAHIVRFFKGIRKDWRELSNIGWALMIFANFLLAVRLIVFKGDFPPMLPYIYVAAFLIVAATIRPSGALNLPFDMIGSFTDVLSYIRLFAVGLSGMYIAQKFNFMGVMVRDALANTPTESKGAELACMIAGVVLMILVAVAGHILNLALGFLGVLVHAVRLNTLEFSNHMGLQWSGFKFKPFSAKQNND